MRRDAIVEGYEYSRIPNLPENILMFARRVPELDFSYCGFHVAYLAMFKVFSKF